eukprot:CAMPEP_0202922192 /NCGR_PEP_ID=MMETSP1392-20130828/77791_1 /ASSEMBLY_ACC=CAM_ASM_000868 /TAXON_ID=225041 /ORGANISM="Chlamydomonas chlamydogama, Strain SAG 11-48b" /LENGTH=579 /DNA_ID=CAMNT_0049615807 /DNA_START=387 /DNA_END=2126 /DNA_ORIENTATION=-
MTFKLILLILATCRALPLAHGHGSGSSKAVNPGLIDPHSRKSPQSTEHLLRGSTRAAKQAVQPVPLPHALKRTEGGGLGGQWPLPHHQHQHQHRRLHQFQPDETFQFPLQLATQAGNREEKRQPRQRSILRRRARLLARWTYAVQRNATRVLYHHLHKSGGTTMCHKVLQAQHFVMACDGSRAIMSDAPGNISPAADCNCNGCTDGYSPFSVLSRQDQIAYLRNHSDASVFFSESPLGDDLYFGPALLHVTLVRHPFSRFLSHLMHFLELAQPVEHQAGLLDINHVVRLHETDPARYEHEVRDNFVTRFYAGMRVYNEVPFMGISAEHAALMHILELVDPQDYQAGLLDINHVVRLHASNATRYDNELRDNFMTRYYAGMRVYHDVPFMGISAEHAALAASNLMRLGAVFVLEDLARADGVLSALMRIEQTYRYRAGTNNSLVLQKFSKPDAWRGYIHASASESPTDHGSGCSSSSRRLGTTERINLSEPANDPSLGNIAAPQSGAGGMGAGCGSSGDLSSGDGSSSSMYVGLSAESLAYLNKLHVYDLQLYELAKQRHDHTVAAWQALMQETQGEDAA